MVTCRQLTKDEAAVITGKGYNLMFQTSKCLFRTSARDFGSPETGGIKDNLQCYEISYAYFPSKIG